MLAGSRMLRGRVSLVAGIALILLAQDVHAQSATYTHEPAGFVPYASSTLDAFTGGGWNIVNNAATATINRAPELGTTDNGHSDLTAEPASADRPPRPANDRHTNRCDRVRRANPASRAARHATRVRR